MREILFRGKTKSGEWFEGSLVKYTDETSAKREEHFRIQETIYGFTDGSNMPYFCDYTSGFDEEVIPETVGQYTGLCGAEKEYIHNEVIPFVYVCDDCKKAIAWAKENMKGERE